MARMPNERFFANRCTACAVADRVCDHAPFGQLFPWQRAWLRAFDSGKARMSHIEVHRRARKTSTAINLQFRECCLRPKTRQVYVGPTFAEARRIVWDDPTMLKSALPDPAAMSYRLNEHHMIIRWGNGSVWQCFGGDDPDSLRGADAQGFVFDEWAMSKLACWTEVLQPIFRQDPSRWVAFLYTPKGANHATRMFDTAACVDEGVPLPVNGPALRCKPGQFALRLTADHSGIFAAEELQAIKDDPNVTEEEYQQEYLCARIMDEEFALITSAMLDRLVRKYERPKTSAAIIACDPSMGGDACAVDVQWDMESIMHKSFRTRDTMRIVGELRRISDETGILDFVIDSIGIGAGIVDRLREDTRYKVIACNAAEGASNKQRFKNLRAEMWWTAREDVQAFACCQPDEETRRQIPFASRYKIGSNGQIQIIEKQKIKEDLGRSPDDADAWAMGRWGIRQARQCAGKMIQHVVPLPVEYQADDPWGDENPINYGKGSGDPW
jgi:hypothetical protein